MTLTLDLSPDLERRLLEETGRQGVAPKEYVLDLLVKHVPLTEEEQKVIAEEKRQRALNLLRSWREEGDAEEQRETFEALVRGLNETRKGGRLHFPPEMKGISW